MTPSTTESSVVVIASSGDRSHLEHVPCPVSQPELLRLARVVTTGRGWGLPAGVPCSVEGCGYTTEAGYVVDGLRVPLCSLHRGLGTLWDVLPPELRP